MFKKTMRYLFVPRTDSPTKAYYAGLIGGLYVSYELSKFLLDRAYDQGWEAGKEYGRATAALNPNDSTPESE